MPFPGWQHQVGIDRHPLPLNFGSPGPHQIYDFTQLNFTARDTIRYNSLDSSQTATLPAASFYIAGHYQDTVYIRADSGAYRIVGTQTHIAGLNSLFIYSSPVTLYRYPVTYGDSFSTAGFFSVTAPGSSFDPPYVYNNVRIKSVSGYREYVDGWGTLLLPGCAYACTRVKRIVHDTIYVDQKMSATQYRHLDTSIMTRTEYFLSHERSQGQCTDF